MPEPYIIRSTGPGEADVVDRATGKRVGVLLHYLGRWEANLTPDQGAWPRVGERFRLRTDAARAVWEMAR